MRSRSSVLLRLGFLLYGKCAQSGQSRLASGLLCPCLCQIRMAFFNMSGGLGFCCVFSFFFLLWSETASFHGHKHFPASQPVWGFAV